MSPRVTIACPVFDAEDYLELELESLVAQSFEDFELFISDNGSTDGTEEICRGFAARDPRVRYVRSAVNNGLGWNWNTLIRGARGQYYKCAAHDDIHGPDYLLRTVEVLDARPDVVLCYPRTIDIDETGAEIGLHDDNLDLQQERASQRFDHMMRHMEFCNPIFGTMRTDVLRCTGWMRPFGQADRVLLAEMCLRGKFFEVPEPQFYRRLFPGRSLELYPEPEALDRFFATRDVPTGYPWTRLLLAHIEAIARAPIPVTERARCYPPLFREWNYYRGAAAEIAAAPRRLLAGRTSSRR